MLKNYSLSFVFFFLSHDILFCMEQTIEHNRRSQEFTPLIANQLKQQLEKCSICQFDMNSEEKKTLKIQPCNHEFHINCFAQNTLMRDSKECPLCRKPAWLIKESLKDVPEDSLGHVVIDMMETRGWFKQPEVVYPETRVQAHAVQSDRLSKDQRSLFFLFGYVMFSVFLFLGGLGGGAIAFDAILKVFLLTPLGVVLIIASSMYLLVSCMCIFSAATGRRTRVTDELYNRMHR